MSSLAIAAVGALAAWGISAVLVPTILDCTEAAMLRGWDHTIAPPHWMSPELWRKFWPRQGGGRYLGAIEVTILFASFWADSGWPLLAAWLAFKVACQWESWKHSSPLIDMVKSHPDKWPEDLLAIQRWVHVRYMSFLVGTGANIVIAFSVASVARVFAQQGFAV